eukprot:scaffold77_cov116-Isochrysis_galbana.AAC.17
MLTRHVSKLEVERLGEVSRPAEARLGGDHADGRKHGNAPMLDLELHIAAVVAARVSDGRREEAERVVHTERRRDANLALRTHGCARAARRHQGRALEGEGGGDDRQHGENQAMSEVE